MNNKLRKQLMPHATAFAIPHNGSFIYIYQEENEKWTLQNQNGEMWYKNQGWGRGYSPSKRSFNKRLQLEMSLEEAYGTILVEKL